MENVSDLQRLFAELIDFNTDAASKGGVDNSNSWQLRRKMEELRRAQELDPTDVLFVAMLEEYLDEFLAETKVTAKAYLDNPQPFDRVLSLTRQVRELLLTSGMYEARDALRANVMRALEHYGAAQRQDVLEMLAKRSSITWLWRDALEAIDKSLSTHQFMQGEPESAGVKPLYQEHVLGFWSINDAIRLAANMPSGISMCMIRDRDAIHSYFAFVIRNGGNLSVVTDVTEWTHPMQRRMTRRPDRTLAERTGQSWFPYELLGIEYLTDEEGDIIGLNVPRQEGLVPHQSRAYKVKRIRDIDAKEVAWTAIMFALMTKKFFADNWKAPQLSYTGEMVDIPRVLEAAAAEAGLPVAVDSYKPLVSAPLHSIELTAERVVAEGKVTPSGGHNNWLEARYAGSVDDALLNMNVTPHGNTMMIAPSGRTQLVSRSDIERGLRWSHDPSHRDLQFELHEFDATTFGTAEQLLADRVFLARFNQAKAIQIEANREYEARKDEIKRWWQKTIETNKERLFDAVRKGRFPVKSDMPIREWSARFNYEHLEAGEHEIFNRFDLKSRDKVFPRGAVLGEPQYNPSGTYTGKRRCAISGRPAGSVAVFTPVTADDLAAIAGIARTELPEVLQHWVSEEPYDGNHILDRIDPMGWAVVDPWRQLDFGVSIYISNAAVPAAPAHVMRAGSGRVTKKA